MSAHARIRTYTRPAFGEASNMTASDFQLIADTLKPFVTADQAEDTHIPVDVICKALADSLRITNPRFDRERFLAACGITHH